MVTEHMFQNICIIIRVNVYLLYCLLWLQDRSVHGETNREETIVNVVIKHSSKNLEGLFTGKAHQRFF